MSDKSITILITRLEHQATEIERLKTLIKSTDLHHQEEIQVLESQMEAREAEMEEECRICKADESKDRCAMLEKEIERLRAHIDKVSRERDELTKLLELRRNENELL